MTLAICIGIFIFWRCLGTPKKNSDERLRFIEEKIISIGGKVNNIEQIKRANCPFCDEVNVDDGSVYNFYKIEYTKNDEIKEGWTILKMQQSIVGPIGALNSEWLWKL